MIKAWHNIPILSYLFLAAKCASCKTRIPFRYPLVELTTVILSLLVAWHFGLSWQMPLALVFTWSLICLALIDFDHQILPDSLTLGLLWLGLLVNLYGLFVPLNDAIIGAMVGYGSLWSIGYFFQFFTGKQGMGHGDFKLLATFGAWLGWQSLLLIVLSSTIVAAFIGISMIVFLRHDRKVPIPFGPFLAIAGWVTLIWGDSIMQAYFSYVYF